LAAALLTAALVGCASGGGVVDRALATVGLKDKQQVEAQARTVPLRLYAADNLNAGTGRKGVALVVRVYQLRDPQRFEQQPFDRFLDPAREREALGNDLIEVSEVVLMPGERHELPVLLAADSRYLGVVGLFRHPGASQWRLAFDRHKAKAEGITVGLHACALTTASPALVTVLAGDPLALAAVRCGGGRG
jgi:type VI secretion system protein VasD